MNSICLREYCLEKIQCWLHIEWIGCEWLKREKQSLRVKARNIKIWCGKKKGKGRALALWKNTHTTKGIKDRDKLEKQQQNPLMFSVSEQLEIHFHWRIRELVMKHRRIKWFYSIYSLSLNFPFLVDVIQNKNKKWNNKITTLDQNVVIFLPGINKYGAKW